MYGPIVGLLVLAASSAVFGHELITDHAVQEVRPFKRNPIKNCVFTP